MAKESTSRPRAKSRAQAQTEKPKAHAVAWEGAELPSEQEAEARLHQEGYESFSWHDVSGTFYPRHRHEHDECLWILKGQIRFDVGEKSFSLKAGDRLYLAAGIAHTAQVPDSGSVTYLVGQKTRLGT